MKMVQFNVQNVTICITLELVLAYRSQHSSLKVKRGEKPGVARHVGRESPGEVRARRMQLDSCNPKNKPQTRLSEGIKRHCLGDRTLGVHDVDTVRGNPKACAST